MEIGKGYTSTEWREDLKVILRKTAEGETNGVFLFTDTQVRISHKTISQFKQRPGDVERDPENAA